MSSSMLTLPDGNGVVMFGGNMRTAIYDTSKGSQMAKSYETNLIIKLNGSTLEWTVMGQTLQYARRSHLVFSFPKEIANCSTRFGTNKKNSAKPINSTETEIMTNLRNITITKATIIPSSRPTNYLYKLAQL